MNTSSAATFGIVDFMVFFGSLVLSMSVGIYFAVVDRKNESIDNYYFAGKQMAVLPVALSISVSFISAMTFIALPTEAYFFGGITLWFSCHILVPTLVACIYYIPLIHRLKMASIFEYLELRFNPGIRKMASVITFITMMFYMSITIYLPALTLDAVTPLGLTWTIALTTLICTIYTTLGGMKAVIWADTLQTVIMAAGSLATLIKAISIVGGFENTYDALERGNRLNFLNFSVDPTIRYTFFSIIIGTGVGGCSMACISQPTCQRYLSCKSVKHARMAAIIAALPSVFFSVIALLSGFAMYAYFEGCDPLMNKDIKKPDQTITYMVAQIFQDTPGMAGVFVAAAFCGTLSTVSSGINSLAAMLLEDFILPLKPGLKAVTQLTISKLTVFVFGLTLMGLALCIQYIPGTVIQVLNSFEFALTSPILGVYTLGIFFPWSTKTGVMIGQLLGTAFTLWVAIGGLFFVDSSEGNQALPTSIDQCPNNLTSADFVLTTTTTYNTNEYYSTLEQIEEKVTLNNTLYAVSYLYHSFIGLISTVTIGLLASFITGAQHPENLDPRLFVPIIDNSRFPEKIVKFFRFGVPEYIDEKVDLSENDFLMYKTEQKEEKYAVDDIITSI